MGFGAEVAAVVQHQAFDWLDAPIERVGAKFAPIPFAPVMEEFVVLAANDVVEAIQRTVANVSLPAPSSGCWRAISGATRRPQSCPYLLMWTPSAIAWLAVPRQQRGNEAGESSHGS